MGIEPTLAAWEAAVLPLNYTREGRHLTDGDGLTQGAAEARRQGPRALLHASPAYIRSTCSAYRLRTSLRFTFSVGVRRPLSTDQGSRLRVTRRILA